MAHVFGEPGRNAAEESHKRTRRFLLIGLVGIAVLSLTGGFVLGVGFSIARLGWELVLLVAFLSWIIAFLIYRWASKKMDAVEQEGMSWRKGAIGEWLTTEALNALPDGFAVINDVTKKLGNIDHVVVGPIGVYVIDVKNWRDCKSGWQR